MQTSLATLTTLAACFKSLDDQPKISPPKGSQSLSTCSLNNTFYHQWNNEAVNLFLPRDGNYPQKNKRGLAVSVYNNITDIA